MESASPSVSELNFMSTDVAAVGFLLLLAALALAVIIRRIARSRLSPFQCLLWVIAYTICKLLWRARWLNELPLPDSRGGIIVCNHRSSIDPFFLQMVTPRKVHWMVAREYCELPGLRWLLWKKCEVIPVRRGGVDTAATKTAIRIVAEGGIVGMLPEGRINMTDEFMLPVRAGAALIALKARVPIVPCYLKGTPYRRYVWSPFLMRARVEIRFGEPLELSEFYGREGEAGVPQEVMRRTVKALAALAGEPDFEPQMAGAKWKPTEQELESAIVAAEARRGSE